MRIRFLKDWGFVRKGTLVDWPAGMARLLVYRGVCVEDTLVETIPDQTIIQATASPAPERAVAHRQRKRK